MKQWDREESSYHPSTGKAARGGDALEKRDKKTVGTPVFLYPLPTDKPFYTFLSSISFSPSFCATERAAGRSHRVFHHKAQNSCDAFHWLAKRDTPSHHPPGRLTHLGTRPRVVGASSSHKVSKHGFEFAGRHSRKIGPVTANSPP